MTAATLLAEARAHGVALYRLGDRLRWRSHQPIAPDLVARLRAHKIEILPLLADYSAIYTTLTATFGRAEDLAALEWYATLNGDGIMAEIAALDCRCEHLAYVGADEVAFRAAVVVLVSRLRQIRTWHLTARDAGAVPEKAASRCRLTLDAHQLVAEPVLVDGSEIADVGKFIAQTQTAIEHVLQQPPRSYPDAAALIRLYIRQLEQVGVVARVESVS